MMLSFYRFSAPLAPAADPVKHAAAMFNRTAS
jgi:hypothetical protein